MFGKMVIFQMKFWVEREFKCIRIYFGFVSIYYFKNLFIKY